MSDRQQALEIIERLHSYVEHSESQAEYQTVVTGVQAIIGTLTSGATCARPGCKETARSRGKYCSDKCGTAMRVRKHRRRDMDDSGGDMAAAYRRNSGL